MRLTGLVRSCIFIADHRAPRRRDGATLAGLVVGAGLVTGAALCPAAAQTITDALAAAYLGSPDLQAARHALDATNEQRPKALGNWLPTVSFGPQYQSTTDTLPLRLGRPTQTVQGPLVVAGITQPITHGGGEYAQLRLADAEIRQARASLLATEQTVLYNAAQAYLSVRAAVLSVGFRIAGRDALRQLADAIDRLLAVNDATAADAWLTRARLAQAQGAVEQANAALQEARARYRQVVGKDAPPGLAAAPTLTLLPGRLGDAVDAAAHANPLVVTAHWATRAAEEGVTVATAALLPVLSINAQATRSWNTYSPDLGAPVGRRQSGTYDSGLFTLEMQVPLYQGGVEYAGIRQARKVALQRRAEFEAARRQAIATVEQAWEQRAGDQATLGALEAEVRAIRTAVAQYRQELGVGLRTILEILDSVQELANAQVGLAQTGAARVLDDYAVLQGMGGLTARTLALPVPYYDPDGDYRRTKWRIFGLGIDAPS